MLKEINVLELSSELADKRLKTEWKEKNGKKNVHVEDENKDTRYKEEAQDVFNDHYDYYHSLITSL